MALGALWALVKGTWDNFTGSAGVRNWGTAWATRAETAAWGVLLHGSQAPKMAEQSQDPQRVWAPPVSSVST